MDTHSNEGDFEQVFFSDGQKLAKSNPVNKDLQRLKSSLRQLHYNTDLLIDAFVQRCANENIPVDCRIGCQWCCYQSVFASTHEIIAVVDYLEKQYPTEAIMQVKERAKEKEERLAQQSPANSLKQSHACPLLRKARCMIYPVRPMGCRIYLSASEKSCHTKYLHPGDGGNRPELFDFPLKAGRQLNEGFASALREEGLKIDEHRIEHILFKLLESPGKKNEWLQGATIHENFPFDELPD
ncbi:MAG: YkgJ family cysteine cluster protein, partial [Marinilabiliaceae bacterium]